MEIRQITNKDDHISITKNNAVTYRLGKGTFSFLCFDIFSAEGNNVTLTEFEASATGMINSFTTRFPGNNSVLEELWRADMPYHKL